MEERRERTKSKERYQLTWSMPATQPSASSVGNVEPLSPDGYLQDGTPVEEEVAAIESVQADEQSTAATLDNAYPPLEGEGYNQYYSPTPKSKSKHALVPTLSAKQVKVSSLISWGGISGAGAAMIAMGPASVMGLHLAELGAIWAGLSVALWLIPSKLM
jgi:hypothetical protein